MTEADKLPEGWKWVRLGEVCQEDKLIVSGADSKLPFVGLEMVESESGKIDMSARTTEGISTCYSFDTRHILYGKLRPYLNKVALPNFQGRCSTELVPLFPKNTACREYVSLLLKRKETVDYVMTEATGSRMPRANMQHLLNMQIPLPPLAEQRRIAAIVDEKLTSVQKLKDMLQCQLDTVNALPAAILRKVFAGEL
jgi:type I restriction enzyme S subunit